MQRALALTQKLGDSEGTLIALCNLAHEYAAADLEVKAIECYRRALPLAEVAGDRDSLSMISALFTGHSAMMHLRSHSQDALAMNEHDQEHDAVARLEQLEREVDRLPRRRSHPEQAVDALVSPPYEFWRA